LDAKVNALEAGALACSISGAGPTCFALTDSDERGTALLEILDRQRILGLILNGANVDQARYGYAKV